MERRSSPRFRLDLSCRLYRGDCETSGQLLDVADGGLAVMTASAATQGDAFRVVITRPGAPRIEVDALAWHSRHVRLASGDSSYLIGLVLSVGFMGVAATAIASLLNRYHWIAYAGTAIIAYVALSMIWEGSIEILDSVS